MQLRFSRYVFGWVILIAHFAAILLYFVYGMRFFQPSPIPDTMQGILTIAPLTSIYVAVFIRYVALKEEEILDEKGIIIRASAFYVQFFVIALFSICLLGGMVFLFETGSLPREQIPLFTGMLDTVFGVYLTTIFSRLFPAAAFVSESKPVQAKPTPPPTSEALSS